MSVFNRFTNMKSNVANQQNILEHSVLLKVELADGTSQLIQIPKVEVCNLGLQIQSEPKTVHVEPVPLIASNVNGILSSSDVEIGDKMHDDKASHYVYKVIKPEDLNLKPIVKTHLTRGRPKKRLKQSANNETKTIIKVEETNKVVKQARTRSGRITKPPKHIEKDFKKIDISDNSKHDLTDLKTCEFEPLRTNETPSQEPLQKLEQHSRKRNIPSRFRCPTCNKAYLGRIKMINHFQKHPDHRSDTIHSFINHTTWNFLVLTSQKHKLGSKGIKFCEELEVLIRNARYLAHFLFKPLSNEEDGYFINENLARLFGITPGKYNIDDSELGRDVSLYEYLENNESNNENCKTVENIRSIKVENIEEGATKDSLETEGFNTFDYIMDNEQSNAANFNTDNTRKDTSDKNEISLNGINLSLETQQNHTDIEFSIPEASHDIIMNKEQVKNDHTDSYITAESSNSTVSNSNCLALVKYEMQPKNNFVFNNHEFNNDLRNQLGNLPEYNNLTIKEKSVFDMENSNKNHTESSEKQNSHMTLQNELRDVDELMLVNVDAGQVSHILDTSSNSDDIMNVDQFVNERFKKLTEPDIDIQNNLLNLELPPLDMFHFHTS